MLEFLDKQNAIYEAIRQRGSAKDRIKTGSLDPNIPWGSVVVVGRLGQETEDKILEWKYQAKRRVGELLSFTPDSALHVTLSNSGEKPDFAPEPDGKIDDLIYLLREDLGNYFEEIHDDFGTIRYPSTETNPSAIIIGEDSVILGGQPDENFIVKIDSLNGLYAFSSNTMQKAWGAHSTLGRFKFSKQLDGEESKALESLHFITNQISEIPPTLITTVDLALNRNLRKGDGMEFRMDPVAESRYVFISDKKSWYSI